MSHRRAERDCARWRQVMVVVAIALGGHGARAQTLRDPEARQGFYFSAGAGANALGAWDKGQRDGTAAGLAYTLHLGEMLTDRWGLGLGIEGGSAARQGVTTAVVRADAGGAGAALAPPGRARGRRVGRRVGEDPSRVGDETHGTYGSLLTAGPQLRRLLHAPRQRRVGRHARLAGSARFRAATSARSPPS